MSRNGQLVIRPAIKSQAPHATPETLRTRPSAAHRDDRSRTCHPRPPLEGDSGFDHGRIAAADWPGCVGISQQDDLTTLLRQLESSVSTQVDPTGRTRWQDRARTAVGAMRPGDPSMGRRDPPSEPAFVSLLEPSESRRRESGPRVNGLMTTAPSDQRASERVMRHDRCSGPPRSAPPPPNPDVSRISSSPDSITPTIASATDSAE